MDFKRSGKELQGVRAAVLGSSSGIGRASALALAEAGADVIVHGRSSIDSANQLVLEIRDLGVRSEAIMADLESREESDCFLRQAWALWDGLDAWLHFAGADILTGPGRSLSFEKKLDTLIEVDLVSTVRLCKEVGRLMSANGTGTILTMGWDQAETGMEGDSGELFSATKGAVMAFTRSLAMSLAPTVRVNCIAPGWVQTSWGETTSKIWHDRVLRETPLRRWGLPEDIAKVARFLVGPEASFMTGQIIRVNGGAVR